MKMVTRHTNTKEQALIASALNLVRVIQLAPRTTQRYRVSLPVRMVDSLSLELREYVEGMFASNDDVDTAELAGQNPNISPERQP